MEIEETIFKTTSHEYQDCYAIASHKSKMISTSKTNIKIWNLNGTMKLQQKLRGHKTLVLCLYCCIYSDQFFSGGLEEMLVWKKLDDWKCIQKESINGVIDINMNSKENILFTSSLDNIIRVWKRAEVFKQWECFQNLNQNQVQYQIITFENLMASSHSQSTITIFRCKTNWIKQQSIQTQHHAIKFIDQDRLICQASYPASLLLFKVNEKNQIFEKKCEYQFTNSTTYNSYSPLIYNKTKQLLIAKNNQSLFIIRVFASQFFVKQIIEFGTPVIQACFLENILIFWDDDTKEFQMKQL